MILADITVEIRDKTLTRLGQVRHEELDLELSDLHNNVGSWRLRLTADHPLAGALRQPGSGIVVTGPDGHEAFSGPTARQESRATADDPAGTITFEGVTDTVLLADHLALPDPTNPDLDGQALAHDVRTGPAESVMHAFVAANIGPAAPAERRPTGLLTSHLVMGADLARGEQVTKSTRFAILGDLLAELAGPDSLGFRIIQRGASLAFETYQVNDRSAEVRLDVYNNTLAGHRVAVTPPGATRVLVAGQGQLTERQFLEIETAESLAAEGAWGRRIERFVDQRNTDDWDELARAGQEVLDEEGFAALAVQAVPMEDSSMQFGRDWYLGDRVGVTVEARPLASTVTGYILRANSEGFRIGALIGSPRADPSSASRLGIAEKRISLLERNAENPNTLPDPQVLSYSNAIPVTATSWADLPNLGTISLTLPQDAIVQVELGAWLSAGYVDSTTIRCGVSVNGTAPQSWAGGAWGQVLYVGTHGAQPGGGQHSTSMTTRLDAGSYTFRARAYKTGNGATGVAYPALRVTPIRWAN